MSVLNAERLKNYVETASTEKLLELVDDGGATTTIMEGIKTILLDSICATKKFSSLVDFERSQDRILFTERLQGASEARFESIPSLNLSILSKHKRAPLINLNKLTARTTSFNAKNLQADKSKCKVQRPPSASYTYYGA